MVDRTITFRATVPIVVSETIDNDEYFSTMMRLWDESAAQERFEWMWDWFLNAKPMCAAGTKVFDIVKKDGESISVDKVVKLTAAQLVEQGIFY